LGGDSYGRAVEKGTTAKPVDETSRTEVKTAAWKKKWVDCQRG